MNKKSKACLICSIVVFAIAVALFAVGYLNLVPRVTTYRTRGYGFSSYSYTYSYGPTNQSLAYGLLMTACCLVPTSILLLILAQICYTKEPKKEEPEAEPQPKAEPQPQAEPAPVVEPAPEAVPQTESQQPETPTEEQSV